MELSALNYSYIPQANYSKNVSFSGGLYKAKFPRKMEIYSGQMNNVTYNIAIGDMTKVKADAYIVPEFNNCASYGGVGGAIAYAGAEKGLDEYQAHVDKNGEQEFGSVVLTDSHGGNSNKLLHTVSVASSKEREFEVVKNSVYNALIKAEENGIKSIVCPALGTGIIGSLTDEQSAKAIMSGVKQFADEGKSMDFSIVIYGSQSAFNDFKSVMNVKSYEDAKNETGERKLDPRRWFAGMAKDYSKRH